jgi:hypothetical protein
LVTKIGSEVNNSCPVKRLKSSRQFIRTLVAINSGSVVR